jgi:flavorubredoxin
MSSTKIADNVFSVGVKDPGLQVFDIIMPIKHGTTYNAYLIKGSNKVALVDTVKHGFTDEYFANVAEHVPVDKIDYLIVNHNEPDHSGSMVAVLEKNPNVEIVCSASALPFVRNVINREARITPVKDNHKIDLGGKTLTFKLMPYMHWPDTLMEYLHEDRILFSNDGFAAHLSPTALFDDEITENIDIDHETSYYFSMIMRPYTGFIRKNLPKLNEFDIRMIAPSHGPVQRRHPLKYINAYKDWSQDKSEGRNLVTIFFASSYGNTESLAKALADHLKQGGFETAVVDVGSKLGDSARDRIEESTAVLIGTPTFNGDAVKPVWDLVGLFSSVYAVGKKAAVFGSYGWGGEGIKLVAERLAGLKLKVFEEQFRARLVPSTEEMTELSAWAGRFAEFVRK